jgi:methyl-accepting chemotaxis protein
VAAATSRENAGINTVVAGIRDGGEQVQNNSIELAQLAGQLNALVCQFKM